MRVKARKELEEWDEKAREQKNGKAEQRAARMTMSVVRRAKPLFRMERPQLKFFKLYLPWRAPQKIKNAFELRYEGQNKEDIETWLRNIIVLIPKKMIVRLEGQTRCMCVQSVLAKWYCGSLTILMELEMRNVGRKNRCWENIHTFGVEEGRSATEIPTANRLMTAAAQECEVELGLVACSLDVKQAFDIVSLLKN